MEWPMSMRTAAAACLAALLCLSAGGAALAQFNVTTYHYDNLRTGWNPNETTLTQGSFSSFGLLQTVSLDDQVDAQPLLVNNETINGSQHNLVYVATENNSVYAIDAQSGQVLLQTNLGAPVPFYDLPGGCNNNGPNLGIQSTPVIDTAAGALYVISYVLQNGSQAYYLHALSLTTLADLVTPVQISASAKLITGPYYHFNASVSRQRAALLLSNGTLYAGFASFCDVSANLSRGWVLGWNESTLAPLAANKLDNRLGGSPDTFFLSSIWMSGYGLAANANGSVYFVTGNSDYSGTTFNKKYNITESAAEMSGDLTTLQSLFTPSDWSNLDQCDCDFGAGGLMLLPPQPGRFPNLAAAAGKDGNLYILDADHLQKNLQTVQIGGCWCGPSYYQDSSGNGRIVASGGGGYGSNTTIGVYINKGTAKPNFQLVSQYGGVANGLNSGVFTSVSSNGTTAGTAIVWVVDRPTDSYAASVDLDAVNPDNGQLLFSEIAGQWPNVGGDSNIVPVAANGLVYVASDQMLTIFGPGGSKKASLPKIRYTDMRSPLAPGEHEIYGTVRSMTGDTIVVGARDGKQLRVDVAAAKRASGYAPAAMGRGLIARGFYDKSGVLLADTILHAGENPAMWPSDR